MTFERSTDYALLSALIRDPRLYPFLSDDFSPPAADASAIEHDALWYIVAHEGTDLVGFWMFVPQNAICWEFHTVMPLDRRAHRALWELIGPGGWLWSHTDCLRAVTNVPTYNRIAHRFGLRAGLTEYGRNPDSFMKNGKLHGQILLGASKPKEPLCQLEQ